MAEELLTPQQLAERLKVKKSTIRRWRQSGKIPVVKISATTFRFDLQEVLAALRQGQVSK